MHGDKSQRQRERALARFENGAVDVLVATDVAARGIDVADITHVVNFDAPGDREAYVHRVGRTGRAGRSGTGISFVLGDQAADMRRIARDLGLASEFDRAERRAGRSRDDCGAATDRPKRRRRRREAKVAARRRARAGRARVEVGTALAGRRQMGTLAVVLKHGAPRAGRSHPATGPTAATRGLARFAAAGASPNRLAGPHRRPLEAPTPS